MEITEVRIKLIELSDDRLQAFCSITIDDSFVIRDLKIIEGANGPFVAMPSRKITCHCPHCGFKNHLRASYCNQCGKVLHPPVESKNSESRSKLYADIAHPINSDCRDLIQRKVVEVYRQELQRSALPGYVSRYDEDYDSPDVDMDAQPPRPRAVRADDPHAADKTDPSRARPHKGDPAPAPAAAKPRDESFGSGIF